MDVVRQEQMQHAMRLLSASHNGKCQVLARLDFLDWIDRLRAGSNKIGEFTATQLIGAPTGATQGIECPVMVSTLQMRVDPERIDDYYNCIIHTCSIPSFVL